MDPGASPLAAADDAADGATEAPPPVDEQAAKTTAEAASRPAQRVNECLVVKGYLLK